MEEVPDVVLQEPPPTKEKPPEALFLKPPPIVEKLAEVVLQQPPEIVLKHNDGFAVLHRPPLIVFPPEAP
jgi:hypothetical protein